MNTCFFHNSDLDGHASGAIVLTKFPDCKMVGVNYGNIPQNIFDNIQNNDIVFVVDFSFPMETMNFLNNKTELIWIDHHISAINEYEDFLKNGKINKPIKGLRIPTINGDKNAKAACLLVWEYLYPHENIPQSLIQLSKYDIWNHDDTDTLYFQYGLRGKNTWPVKNNIDLWDKIFFDVTYYYDVIKNGEIIFEYETKQNELNAKSNAFDLNFENYNWCAININRSNSKIVDSVFNPKKHNGVLTFGYTKYGWRVSLYTTDININVAEICKKYGGGGHSGAAGFPCKTLPFLNLL